MVGYPIIYMVLYIPAGAGKRLITFLFLLGGTFSQSLLLVEEIRLTTRDVFEILYINGIKYLLLYLNWWVYRISNEPSTVWSTWTSPKNLSNKNCCFRPLSPPYSHTISNNPLKYGVWYEERIGRLFLKGVETIEGPWRIP